MPQAGVVAMSLKWTYATGGWMSCFTYGRMLQVGGFVLDLTDSTGGWRSRFSHGQMLQVGGFVLPLD